MDLNAELSRLKQEPGFKDQVGMVLIHNGVVRGCSRDGSTRVDSLQVLPDQNLIQNLRREYEARPGIFRIVVKAFQGTFEPGEDLLYIIVAGDIRENVQAVLSELLNRIKSEAVTKKES